MSESTPWIEDEDPPPPPRPGLPRLQIIHLMMWMAATAAAFLPFQLQQRMLARNEASGGVESPAETPVVIALNVVHGMCYGATLFVAAAAIVWSLRGYAFRFEPCHFLAFEASFRWFGHMATCLMLYGDRDWSESYFTYLLLPHYVANVVFFFWYLVLAARRGETRAWRLAFVVFALAPIAGFVVQVVAGSYGLLGQLCDMGLQGVALAGALITDLRRQPSRHWSHWAVGVAMVVLTAAPAAYYTWWIFTV
jgi:hypothetical protein